MLNVKLSQEEGSKLYGEDYWRPKTVFDTGIPASTQWRHLPCKLLTVESVDQYLEPVRMTELNLGSPARTGTLKRHGTYIPLVWTWEEFREKRIPAKPRPLPFGIISEQVRESANGRDYFKFLHANQADVYTWAGPEHRGHRSPSLIRTWHNTAVNAIDGRHPIRGDGSQYDYAYSESMFKSGNLWTMTCFNEEKFYARWSSAISANIKTREQMFSSLSAFVERQADHEFYLDWRHYLVDDAHYVLDSLREVFWAAAHAINSRNIVTGDEEVYYRRSE